MVYGMLCLHRDVMDCPTDVIVSSMTSMLFCGRSCIIDFPGMTVLAGMHGWMSHIMEIPGPSDADLSVKCIWIPKIPLFVYSNKCSL